MERLMAINSKQKGSSAERAAAKYLRSLGFESAKRGQQHKGGGDSPDLIVDDLPNIHFECKWDEKITLGSKGKTQSLNAAILQSIADCPPHKTPVVLWKRNSIPWRLSWNEDEVTYTVCGDDEIKHVLGMWHALYT